MDLPQIDDYRSILLNDTPLLDVRAPVEFIQGAFPFADESLRVDHGCYVLEAVIRDVPCKLDGAVVSYLPLPMDLVDCAGISVMEMLLHQVFPGPFDEARWIIMSQQPCEGDKGFRKFFDRQFRFLVLLLHAY